MGIDVEVPTPSRDAGQYIRAARANMRQVKNLLSQPSEQHAEESAALLREVEVQLGCAVAIVKTHGSEPAQEIRSALEGMQGEIAVLAMFFAEADKLLTEWLRTISSRRSGYTTDGRAAPLVLLRKLSVEG